MSLQHPVARARGLGSAKEGVSHWWSQRVTAVALVPLSLYFVFSILRLVGKDHAAAVHWLHNPFNAVLMLALLFATFYHAALGVQMVIEDYVHTESRKIAGLLITKYALFLLGVSAAMFVLKVAIGG